MDMKLVSVPVPVSNVDRAKSFYVEKVGFDIKTDFQVNDTRRVVQLTPSRSACSIVFGTGMLKIEMQTGSLRGLHLAVADNAKTRQAPADRGIEGREIEDVGDIKFVSFSDPDGNT